jgi:transposase-like protein
VSGKQKERREFWRQKVAQQNESSQSVRVFCREHGLGEHSFYAWRQRLRKEGAPVRFTLVETKPAGAAECQPLFGATAHFAKQVVGGRAITPLLARLFAEELVSAVRGGRGMDSLPATIPDLMLSYVNNIK